MRLQEASLRMTISISNQSLKLTLCVDTAVLAPCTNFQYDQVFDVHSRSGLLGGHPC
jgi:hypothetical protein